MERIDSFYRFMDFIGSRYADRAALAWYDDTLQTVCKKSYSELTSDVRTYVGALRDRLTDCKGRHIALLASNSYEATVCMLAVFCADAVLIPLDVKESCENIRKKLERSDASVILYDGAFSVTAPELRELPCELLDIGELKKGGPDCEPAVPENTAAMSLMVFTSGTTGAGKAVMLSQDNIFASLEGSLYFLLNNNLPAQKYFLIGQLYHISGIVGTIIYLLMGCEVDICRDIKFIYRDLKLFGSTSSTAFPVVAELWAKDLRRGKKEKLCQMKSFSVASARLRPELFGLFAENGIVAYQTYGMTELFGGGTLGTPERYKSVGKPSYGVEIRIEDGEICIRSRSVMLGYYKDPESTAKVLRDGWLYTGDLGYFDEDGYLYLTGRKKNTIILASGENISPEELEELLLKNGDILEAVVKGKDEKICAEIFCAEAAQEPIREYIRELNRTLPMYKRMTLVEFRSTEFEKTPNGKIRRG